MRALGRFTVAGGLQKLALYSASARSISPHHEWEEIAVVPLTLPRSLEVRRGPLLAPAPTRNSWGLFWFFFLGTG